MGCDIHMFTEQKNKENIWENADHFTRNTSNQDAYQVDDEKMKGWNRIAIADERNYLLFGMLAGVRRDPEGHFVPKGMPSDASEITQSEFEAMGGDAHTPSWLTIPEIEQKKWDADSNQLSRLLEQLETHFKSKWNFVDYDDKYKERCRIVFWFDN